MQKKKRSNIQDIMANLPVDQEGRGRHKCAACAYEYGRVLGRNMAEHFDIGQILNSLEDSQAQNQRHKSPHAAYAIGHLQGGEDAYK